MEGYYNNSIFHRLIKDFLVQTGDPTGTGRGGSSIYGIPFKNELHSRLKFTRHGIVAMAGGQGKNNSQFFITLGPCSWLNKKYTIFGKITGESIYNVFQFNKLKVDDNDKPTNTKKIIFSKVLMNPFPDIVPREKKKIKNEFINDSKNIKSFTLPKTKRIRDLKVNQSLKKKNNNKNIDLLQLKKLQTQDIKKQEKMSNSFKSKRMKEIWEEISKKRTNSYLVTKKNREKELVDESSESFDPLWFVKQIKFQKRPQDFKVTNIDNYLIEDTRKFTKQKHKKKTITNYFLRNRKLRLKKTLI